MNDGFDLFSWLNDDGYYSNNDKIDEVDNSEEYEEENIPDIKGKKKKKGMKKKHYPVSEKTEKINTLWNTVLNLCLIILLSNFYLSHDVSIVKFYSICCIVYIIYDIFSIFLNKVVYTINDSIIGLKKVIFKSRFRKYDTETQLKIIAQMEEKMKDNSIDSLLNNDFSLIKEQIEECQEQLSQKEKAEAQIDDAITFKDANNYQNALLKFNNIKKQKNKCPKEFFEEYNNIITLTDKLLKEAGERLYVMDGLNKTFNIYFNELQNLFTIYKTLDEEEQENNSAIINEILQEFKKHIVSLREKVSHDDRMKFDINSKILLDSLKKGEDKHGE